MKLNFYVHFHGIIYYKLAGFIQHLQWVVGYVTSTKVAQIMLSCRDANS